MNEVTIENKRIGSEIVTILSYDMDTNDDSNINASIKDLLKRNGWQDEIEGILRQFGANDRIMNLSLPSTTLWKANCEPKDAIVDFEGALIAYDTNNENKKIAYGKAVAFNGNEYAAVEKVR